MGARWWCLAVAIGVTWAPAEPWAQTSTVYRCPGKTTGPDGRRSDEYTNNLTAQQARDLGCRTIEGAPITVIQTTPRAPVSSSGSGGPAVRPEGGTRVPAADQRARDTERRSILEAELRSSQDKLDEAQRAYNNGEPERLGDERNYAKYQARVADLKATVERHEGDVASIRREIAKLP